MRGSSGIGRVTAQKFAERWAYVVVTSRNTTGLHSLVDEIRAAVEQPLRNLPTSPRLLKCRPLQTCQCRSLDASTPEFTLRA